MINRIFVKNTISDTNALNLGKRLKDLLKGKSIKLFLLDVFAIEKELTNYQLKQTAEALTNPISQTYAVNKLPLPDNFTNLWEIGFLPGVTDNIAGTAKEIIKDLLHLDFTGEDGVYTSQITVIDSDLTEKEVRKLTGSLYNPLIQRISVMSRRQFKKNGFPVSVSKVILSQPGKTLAVNLEIPDEELTQIGKEGILNESGIRRGPLALDLMSLKTIKKYFQSQGRSPTDIELESLAQTWSEHCKHTIFNNPLDDIKEGLYKTYIKKATKRIRKTKGNKDICASVFTDNSGAIIFDDKYLITHKVETHNSPSALDPFGGAITGIVGVNRDAIGFGLGAKPVANTYGFCFADPFKSKTQLYRDAKLTQPVLSPKRIMEGVIEGVNAGGNCSGIPTAQGFMYFNQRYAGKPLVFVGTVGLIPKNINGKKSHLKKAVPGDKIVMVGGKVGADGIHGATFSSEALSGKSPATAVQIGDPITQKKLSDALIKEARDRNLYHSITDNGAGGLSCSVSEMAKESGGCRVYLDKIPLKYPGLEPWQIWISESQERMTLAVPENKVKELILLMESRGVEATVIGKFTNSGRCIVEDRGNIIMDLEMDFLHDGLPKKLQFSKPPQKKNIERLPKLQSNLTKIFLKLISGLNCAGFEFLSGQYDYEVQGGSVLKPLQGKGRINSETTVFRPVLDSKKGVVLTQGLYPLYSEIDPYKMAAAALDTAVRNAVSVGADINKIALLDNFCWCSSTDPKRLWQLKEAARACYDYALTYKTPFISGKDSMFNDFSGFDEKGKPVKISALPTLLISSLGIIDNADKALSLDAKFPGDLIYLLGETTGEMGGSEYFNLTKSASGKVPGVTAKKNLKLYKTYFRIINKGLIASAVSLGKGGLVMALAKTAMAGKMGMDISLKNLNTSIKRDDFILFSESQGRILVTVSPANKKQFEKMMSGIYCKSLGKVTDDNQFTVYGTMDEKIISTDTNTLLKHYKKTFKDL